MKIPTYSFIPVDGLQDGVSRSAVDVDLFGGMGLETTLRRQSATVEAAL